VSCLVLGSSLLLQWLVYDDWLHETGPVHIFGSALAASRGSGPKEYRNVLRRSIQPKARELGLPNVTWRLLRHWHTTVLQDSGVPVKVAQERLGHSRPEITLRHYTHVTANKADEAALVMSAMFAPTPSVNIEGTRT
jgi:integrase